MNTLLMGIPLALPVFQLLGATFALKSLFPFYFIFRFRVGFVGAENKTLG